MSLWVFEGYSQREKKSKDIIEDIINFDIPTSDYTKKSVKYITEEYIII